MPFPPSRPLVTLNCTRTTEKHKRLGAAAIRRLSVNSAVVCLLFTGLIVYLCAPVTRILTAAETAVAEEYFEQSGCTLEGIILREEIVIPRPKARAVPIAEDGQALAAGAQLAVCGDQFILAPAAGIYLRETDGFEHLSPQAPTDITPAALNTLLQTPAAGTPDLGKIIVGSGWLFAASADAQWAEQLQEGSSAVLNVQTETPFSLTATVLHISPAENGRCVVVFRCIDHLRSTAHLRQLSVTLTDTVLQGLRIPTQAVHIDEAGSFVYKHSASRAEKTYVTILSENSDFTVVSRDSSAHALHAGDTIIISAPNLTDGRLIP